MCPSALCLGEGLFYDFVLLSVRPEVHFGQLGVPPHPVPRDAEVVPPRTAQGAPAARAVPAKSPLYPFRELTRAGVPIPTEDAGAVCAVCARSCVAWCVRRVVTGKEAYAAYNKEVRVLGVSPTKVLLRPRKYSENTCRAVPSPVTRVSVHVLCMACCQLSVHGVNRA